MKSFAATLFVAAASAGWSGYGGSSRGLGRSLSSGRSLGSGRSLSSGRSLGGSLQKIGYKTNVNLVPVTTYENQTRNKTVYDNISKEIRVPRTEQRTRTEYDTINQTVYDNVP